MSMSKEDFQVAKQQLFDLAAGCEGFEPVPVKPGEPPPRMKKVVSGGRITLNADLYHVLSKLSKGKLKSADQVNGEDSAACYEVSCLELHSIMLGALPKED